MLTVPQYPLITISAGKRPGCRIDGSPSFFQGVMLEYLIRLSTTPDKPCPARGKESARMW